MPNQQLNIAALQSGGLITNYFCTSSCQHCLYRCSPKWPKEYINTTTAEKNFGVIRRLGCNSVHIGGGEPFLRPDDLADVLAAANKSAMHVEYVETNSSWFRNMDSACRILEKLAGLGLTTLLVSISPFHNEYIPFARVKGVIAACRKTGISIFPWSSEFIGDLEAFDENSKHPLSKYFARFGEQYIEQLPGRYWISPGGRALETFGGNGIRQSVPVLLQSERCSRELSAAGHFHLDLFGNYIPGLCAGLSIRREDLGKTLSSEDYPLISRLYAGGIGALCRYVQAIYDFRPGKPDYWTKCELCYEIRRFLVIDKKMLSHELQPAGHYLYG